MYYHGHSLPLTGCASVCCRGGGGGRGVTVLLEVTGLSVGGGMRRDNLVSKFVRKLLSAILSDDDSTWDIASTVADVFPPPSLASLSAVLTLPFFVFLFFLA